jgi:beta-glucosidase
MLNMKSRNILPLLAVGFLAAPACSLDPPPRVAQGDSGKTKTCDEDYVSEYIETVGGIDGGAGGIDGGASGSDNGIDGGSTVGGTIDPIPVCNADNTAAYASLFKYTDGYQRPADMDKTLQDLLATMPLSEKADQMRGTPYGSISGPQMGDTQRSLDTEQSQIRGFRYRDASRGVNFAEDMEGVLPSAGIVQGTPVGYSTAFPVSMARGAAFDLDLEYEIGEAIGDEMQAAKQTLLLAPCMNILRNPLWGRSQETYGEDTFLIGRMASAMALGVQQHIAANAKHFMAYDVEEKRMTNNSILQDEQTLREIFGRHFRMVVQDGGVASVMAAYNMVNGTKSTESRHLLTDVLRDDFGFKGFVLSDWWAMTHAFTVAPASDLKITAKDGVNAGLDVELPWALNYSQIESLVASGELSTKQIDDAAGRVLEQKLRFNSDKLSGTPGLGSPDSKFSSDRISCEGKHVRLSRHAAIKSMVLLKNDGPVLPISKSVQKVAVLGSKVPYRTNNNTSGGTSKESSFEVNFATDVLTGDMGSSRVFHDPAKGVSPFQGIQSTAPAGVEVVTGTTADAAADADFIVVMAGLTPGDEGEEYTTNTGDRRELALDAKLGDTTIQTNLILSAAALGKPVVVVLIGGSVIDTSAWLDQVSAVVMAWYPGQRGGEALGQLLWGKANFGGKLPFTWSNRLDDYPPFGGKGENPNFTYYLGYRYFEKNLKSPLFPFGYGLSYTTFEYRKLQLGCTVMGKGAVLPVVVNVANTGTVAGDEIVMVFVSFPNTAARRGPKELKGFARVSLQPGEEKQVTIPVRLADLDYFQQDSSSPNAGGRWVVESGDVKIMVGGSSTNLPLSATVQVNGY